MGVSSLGRITSAPQTNLPKTAKASSKSLPKISAGSKIPLQDSQWLCLHSLLHSAWKRPGFGVPYPRFSYTSPGDAFCHQLPNFAQCEETVLVPRVRMQLFFYFSAPCGSTGVGAGSFHASLLLLPQEMSSRAGADNAGRSVATRR